MQVKALCSSIALGVMLAGQTFAAQPATAEQWLQRLQDAQSAQSYQGSFVYERKGAFSTHQVWHQIDAQGRLLERFLQLNGPAHEVMRTDGRISCISSNVAEELAAVDVWPATSLHVEQLQHSYDVRVLKDSRVAGHAAAVLLFAPRDQHRYAVEMHMDKATAIPLKTLLLNEHGELLERLQFVQFDAQTESGTEAQALSAVVASEACEPIRQARDTQPQQVERESVVSWTPPGFVLQRSHYKPASDESGGVLSQVYSDGLAHFSVFYEPLADSNVEAGRRQIGPTSVVSKKVVHGDGYTMVTVIGELPMGSAERVALSVHAQQDESHD